MADNKDKNEKFDPRKVSIAEWLTALLGLLLVCGALGFLVYQVVAGDQSPPMVRVEKVAVVSSRAGSLVKFDAKNDGGQTATSVVIEGVLEQNGEEIESSETTLDYVPGHSHRGGGLFFTKDPAKFEMKLRAKGYQEP